MVACIRCKGKVFEKLQINIGKHELHVVDSVDAEDVISKKSDAHNSKESSRFANRLKEMLV